MVNLIYTSNDNFLVWQSFLIPTEIFFNKDFHSRRVYPLLTKRLTWNPSSVRFSQPLRFYKIDFRPSRLSILFIDYYRVVNRSIMRLFEVTCCLLIDDLVE